MSNDSHRFRVGLIGTVGLSCPLYKTTVTLFITAGLAYFYCDLMFKVSYCVSLRLVTTFIWNGGVLVVKQIAPKRLFWEVSSKQGSLVSRGVVRPLFIEGHKFLFCPCFISHNII